MIVHKLMTAALVFGMMGTGSALAQEPARWPGEFLAPAADAGMVLGWINPGDPAMREFVPRGQTVEAWTRMVTVQRMPWRIGVTPAAFLTMLAERMEAACPGARVTPVGAAPLGAREGAIVRVACPRNPATGARETMFARAVQGDRSIMVIQSALKGVPGVADVRWATGVLEDVAFCAEGDEARRCGTLRGMTVGAGL